MTDVRQPPVGLRLEPKAIPAVRQAVEVALSDLGLQLITLQQSGYIKQAWLGDPVSEEVKNYYNAHVMDAKDGPYAAMVAYQSELINLRDTLKGIEDRYRHAEGDNAALWGGE